MTRKNAHAVESDAPSPVVQECRACGGWHIFGRNHWVGDPNTFATLARATHAASIIFDVPHSAVTIEDDILEGETPRRDHVKR